MQTPTSQRLSACPLRQEMDQSLMTTTMPSASIDNNVGDVSAQQQHGYSYKSVTEFTNTIYIHHAI